MQAFCPYANNPSYRPLNRNLSKLVLPLGGLTSSICSTPPNSASSTCGVTLSALIMALLAFVVITAFLAKLPMPGVLVARRNKGECTGVIGLDDIVPCNLGVVEALSEYRSFHSWIMRLCCGFCVFGDGVGVSG